jgi:hypothetical protein
MPSILLSDEGGKVRQIGIRENSAAIHDDSRGATQPFRLAASSLTVPYVITSEQV